MFDGFSVACKLVGKLPSFSFMKSMSETQRYERTHIRSRKLQRLVTKVRFGLILLKNNVLLTQKVMS